MMVRFDTYDHRTLKKVLLPNLLSVKYAFLFLVYIRPY